MIRFFIITCIIIIIIVVVVIGTYINITGEVVEDICLQYDLLSSDDRIRQVQTYKECIKLYKMYDEQKENIKHQKNSPEMWGKNTDLI
jgi:hypothetical protein